MSDEKDMIARHILERQLYSMWAVNMAQENANLKMRTDARKKERDELIARSGEKRSTAINGLIGAILSDMTNESYRKASDWNKIRPK